MASSENKRELILTRSPGRLMVSLSLPAIVGMVVIGLYTFVDAIYAGQLIGVDAMGAVSIAYPFTFINSGLAAMIGMGSASVLSRAIGARDQKSIDQVMGNLVVMNLVLSLAVTVVGVAFARPLLALTGAEGAMLDLGECYLRIIFLGSLFVNFAQSSNMIMRGEGELARAMGIMAGGAILNMVLAPVFILALRDQGLGLEGAACATVLSQAVLAGVMLWWFVKREKTARIVRVAASRAVLAEVAKVGVSAMLMQVLTLVQQAIIYRAAAEWGGAEWQVLFGAALRIQSFAFIPLWGMSNGFQPAAGTNYGAGLYGRVREAFHFFFRVALIAALALSILGFLFAPQVVALFRRDDPEVIYIGALALRLQCITFPLMSWLFPASMTLQTIGRSFKATVLAMCRQGLTFVPLILVLPYLWGVFGIQASQPLADILTFAVALPMGLGVLRELRLAQEGAEAQGTA